MCLQKNRPEIIIDAPGRVVNSASYIQISPQALGGTVQDALDKAKEEFEKSKKCCVKTLVWILHGSGGEFMIVGPGNRNRNEYNHSRNPQKATMIDKSNANAIAESFSTQLKFCTSCTIYLLSCNTGVKEEGIPQSFANKTGCTVFAPRGYCYPNPQKPEQSRIDSHYKDYPIYPGSKDGEFREYTSQ